MRYWASTSRSRRDNERSYSLDANLVGVRPHSLVLYDRACLAIATYFLLLFGSPTEGRGKSRRRLELFLPTSPYDPAYDALLGEFETRRRKLDELVREISESSSSSEEVPSVVAVPRDVTESESSESEPEPEPVLQRAPTSISSNSSFTIKDWATETTRVSTITGPSSERNLDVCICSRTAQSAAIFLSGGHFAPADVCDRKHNLPILHSYL